MAAKSKAQTKAKRTRKKKPKLSRGEKAAKQLEGVGLPGITLKFVIRALDEEFKVHEHNFYLTIPAFENKIDLLDLRLGGTQEHNIRALIESEMKLATMLLRSGKSLDKLVEHWIGYRFEPHGVCPQLIQHYGYESPNVASPLDAVAKILKAKFLEGQE